ncbi:DNA helicase UvrD [Candidatus Pacearchaeota archaeon]|nr:DNA helicase UvrD [Candidatus Pacearchaeota archaeon]
MKAIAETKNSHEFLVSSKTRKKMVFADLQVHSKHARATSSALSLANLEKYGKIKGLDLIGTGDFQHPLHRKEINSYIKEEKSGILYSNSGFPFLWQTEVSLMFSQGGKRRAVHLLIFVPNTDYADKITEYLGSKGRLDYDGRPIFGMSCKQLVHDLKLIDDMIEIIPAHCMTPWFGLFGSKSGFDSLEECFEEESKHIYAIESGMSADPPMLCRFKEVGEGKVRIVSFSDAHSFWPWRIGREATIFDIPELTYGNIIKAIRTGRGLAATIETVPDYGKYHYDGHRNCNFSCSPEETKHINGICPKCKNPLTIGVEYRAEELSVFPAGFKSENASPFYDMIPLHELIAFHKNTSMNTKTTWTVYNSLIEKFKDEFNILLSVTKGELLKHDVDAKLAELIILNRENKLKIKPGYDGVYGIIQMPVKQKTLF